MTASSGRNLRAMDEDARKEFWACLALRHSRGLGARSVCRLLRAFGSAYAAVQARERWPGAGVDSGKAAVLGSGSWRVTARREWESARALDALVVFWKDPEYPPLLRRIPDAPPLLYCRGDISLLRAPGFAVVGSRKATRHGRAVAEYMARCLSACGLTIVSGMALGIDRVAHEAALRRVGRSIGVLGTGIDRVYPRQNASVFAGMERYGLLVSEFAPGTPPQADNFPVRNRIISGLALGVLVVEAAGRSGSLITARLALEQNREVYAVPGPALDAHCLGSQELVRQGAHAVFCAEDVLRDLAEQLRPYGISEKDLPEEAAGGPEPPPAAAEESTAPSAARQGPGSRRAAERAADPAHCAQDAALTAGERAAAQGLAPAGGNAVLLDYLRAHGPTQADVLAASAGLSAAAANAALIGLEMLGQVRRLPGARYEAVP